MNYLKLTLIASFGLCNCITALAQGEPQGYDPMSFKEFWKPDPEAGITGKIKEAKTIPQVQGIVLMAIKSQPTQLMQVAASTIKGANTQAKIGCIVNLVLSETLQLDPSKYYEVIKAIFTSAPSEMQAISAGFIIRYTPEEYKHKTAELLILVAPEAVQGDTLQEIARELGLESFNILLSSMWTELDIATQQRLTILLRSSFDMQ